MVMGPSQGCHSINTSHSHEHPTGENREATTPGDPEESWSRLFLWLWAEAGSGSHTPWSRFYRQSLPPPQGERAKAHFS